MVDEVSAALSWTLDNIESYGGSAKHITVVGHSAGAHLWMMALLHRARSCAQPCADTRMPACFIGRLFI